MPDLSALRLKPMRPRDPDEPGRVASSLELFFDLVFVISVSAASAQLYEALSQGRAWDGILNYAIVFFGIWWAWMNFTWFATSFDTDDWLYRTMTIAQMGGVLVLAAGVQPAFTAHNFSILIFAYVLMRCVMVAQWLRASRTAGESRHATLIYAGGIAAVQALWLASLALPSAWFYPAMIALILAEISVPIIAERTGQTPWHPHHITERYSLFTLIVLGESLLGSATAIMETVQDGAALAPLLRLAVLVLIATASLWWLYFWPPHHAVIGSFTRSVFYGYGHYVIFAMAGAFSAGIKLEIDVLTGQTAIQAPWSAFAYTVPLSIFVFSVWLLAVRPSADRYVNTALPVAALLVLIDPLIPVPFAVTTIVLAAVVAVLVWRSPNAAAD